MEVVDSHIHLWSRARGDYDWLTSDLTEIFRDFGPEDYAPTMYGCDTFGAVLVQAAPTVAETEYLLELAQNVPWIRGVVGWVNFELDAVPTLKRLAHDPLFKGVRPMLQDIALTDWVLNCDFTPVFETLESLSLTFDALVQPRHLDVIARLMERHSSLRLVIDHCAKPNISARQFDDWALSIGRLADCPNVSVKFSGLTTEARKGESDASVYAPYLKHLFSTFGEDRVMWGSDWPVVNLSTSAQQWFEVSEELTRDLSAEHRQKFWSRNAQAFYGLNL